MASFSGQKIERKKQRNFRSGYSFCVDYELDVLIERWVRDYVIISLIDLEEVSALISCSVKIKADHVRVAGLSKHCLDDPSVANTRL